jgi:hypothetical protein
LHHAEAIHSGDPISFSTAIVAVRFQSRRHSMPCNHYPQRLTVPSRISHEIQLRALANHANTASHANTLSS